MYSDHGRISRLPTFRRDSMHADVLRAINVQINSEFSAWYQYLAMAAFCEREMFTGAAKWLKTQSAEEYQHGMKLFDFVHARNGVVELLRIEQPRRSMPCMSWRSSPRRSPR
jgi:ferritin